MASEIPTKDDPSTPSDKQPIADTATPPVNQSTSDANVDSAGPAPSDPGPQGQPFAFYTGQDGAPNGDLPHDAISVQPGSGMNMPVPYPTGMPVYQYGNVMPGPPHMTRPKRTQCKNACTNCQKACKKCDDNRPCHRCVRYGTTETCVDSKRKERKKGVKRGPYRKRDGKAQNADDNEGSGAGSGNGLHGPTPSMPYVGPVGYPPGMWSGYSPGGSGAKIEGGSYFQPVFALTPVGGQQPHGSDNENSGGGGGGGEVSPFPVGFYPATFISYPGPYPPYAMPQGQGSPPHGFHYAYPPPPGVYSQKPPRAGTGNPNSEQGASSSSAEPQAKDTPEGGAVEDEKGEDKVIEPQGLSEVESVDEPHVNGVAGTETK